MNKKTKIINILDPDMFQCESCNKWIRGKNHAYVSRRGNLDNETIFYKCFKCLNEFNEFCRNNHKTSLGACSTGTGDTLYPCEDCEEKWVEFKRQQIV